MVKNEYKIESPYSGIKSSRHENGQIWYVGEYDKGSPRDLFVCYNDNGTTFYKQCYNNNGNVEGIVVQDEVLGVTLDVINKFSWDER